jgi:hypothetical protein
MTRRSWRPRLRLRLRLPRPRLPRSKAGRRRLASTAIALLLLLLWWLHGDAPRAVWPRPAILQAIRLVESSGRDDVADGDGGLAIGPFQIHQVYWRDAIEFDPSLGGDYQRCRQRRYAERVIDAFMRRHAAAAWLAGDAEVIARVHNGGPQGANKAATLGYWQRVRSRLP